MTDAVDLKLWKMQMAWELAMRVIPAKPDQSGEWTKNSYLAKAQETLTKANEVIDAVFKVIG